MPETSTPSIATTPGRPARRRPPPISIADLGRTSDLIHLSLSAIARGLPPEQAGESLKALPEHVRVTFPFAWIEPQLAKGNVALPRARFFEVVPVEIQPGFHLAEDATVALPLDEILLNLPGPVEEAAPQPQPATPRPVAAPAEPKPAPAQAISASATDQSVLQAILMTEEDLDLEKIAGLVSALPGLEGCIASSGERSATGGDIKLSSADIRAIGFQLSDSAEKILEPLALGKVKSQTLHCEGALFTFFVRRHVCLCVFHRGGRGFLPGVREKLDAVAGQMARSM